MKVFLILPFLSFAMDLTRWKQGRVLTINHPTGKPAISYVWGWFELTWRNRWVKGAVA